MAENPLFIAENLAALRGERVLFRDVSLALSAGDIVLLRGQNGSGKTTLLRQLAGLSEPAKGAISRFGRHHWLGHDTGLKAHDTPRSHLQHWARVWGSADDQQAILSAYGLKRPADIPARLLSAGQKRRTALARMKLEQRPVWLLDEPLTALDDAGRALVISEMTTHLAAGGAILAAIHGDFALTPTREVLL